MSLETVRRLAGVVETTFGSLSVAQSHIENTMVDNGTRAFKHFVVITIDNNHRRFTCRFFSDEFGCAAIAQSHGQPVMFGYATNPHRLEGETTAWKWEMLIGKHVEWHLYSSIYGIQQP